VSTKLVNCCDNLNQSSQITSLVGEDFVTTVNISGSSFLLPADTSRRIAKIYLISQSNPDAEIWIRYGVGATLANSSHPLLLKHLLIINSSQVANAISAICSSGTAQLRVSSASIS
jgi:hypothetical protein